MFLVDDDYVGNKVAEAVVAAFAYPNVKVFLDTFIDHDRGYFPHIGIYDRRVNPRKGGYVMKNLQTAIRKYGSRITLTEIKDEDRRVIIFETKSVTYRLTLPRKEKVFMPQQGSTLIDLVSGEINPQKITSKNQMLEISTSALTSMNDQL